MEKLKQIDLSVGSKVHYQPEHYDPVKYENGIVKEIPRHTTQSVRVVYNCNNEWDKYQDYTSAMTRLEDLKKGWKTANKQKKG